MSLQISSNYQNRLNPENRDRILSQSEKSLAMIRKHVASAICPRITSETFYEHHRYISPGFQEYIEAASLYHYLKHGTLPSPQDLQDCLLETYKESDANVLPLHMDDYILGIADVTGELMRRAISHKNEAEHIREVLEQVLRGCESVRGVKSRDWSKKLQVMKASLEKVERTLFRNVITDAELQSLSTVAT